MIEPERPGVARPHYDVEGHGDPLVLLNGWMHSRHEWPDELLRPLRDRFTIIRISTRGLDGDGASSDDLTMDDLAADCLAVLDRESVDRAAVFGHSLGGMVAQVVAWSAPERVRALVLAATSPPHPTGVRLPLASRPRAGTTGTSRRQLVTGVSKAAFGAGPARAGSTTSFKAAYAQLKAMLSHRAEEKLARITAPSLVLHGTEDGVVLPALGHHLARSIGGDYCEVPGAGHDLPGERPDVVASTLISFLTETLDGQTTDGISHVPAPRPAGS